MTHLLLVSHSGCYDDTSALCVTQWLSFDATSASCVTQWLSFDDTSASCAIAAHAQALVSRQAAMTSTWLVHTAMAWEQAV